MVGQIVEISQNDYYLKKYRGFLEIHEGDERKAQLALDDIVALVISAPNATLSKNIMVSLAGHNIPIVLCGANYMPAAMVLPASFPAHSLCHPLKQAAASKGLNHLLWQQIIRAKISNQHHLAKLHNPDHISLQRLKWLAENVKSNDNQNHEGEAAKLYFPLLFDKGFIRDPNLEGKNSQLNYGYAILRAAAARALTAHGLSCALGIFHKNLRNSFCLADDIMEPYRPLVDEIILSLDDEVELSRKSKAALANLIHKPITTPKGRRPLYLALQEVAAQLAEIYNKGKGRLNLYDWW